MSRSLRKVGGLITPSGCTAKSLVILHPRFPRRHVNVIERNEFHPRRIGKRLPGSGTGTLFQAGRQKRLLLRFHFATDGSRFVTSEPQLVSRIARFYFLDRQRCLPKLFPVRYDGRASRRAGDLDAAIRKDKVGGVFALRVSVDSLPFVRPSVEMRQQFVRARR